MSYIWITGFLALGAAALSQTAIPGEPVNPLRGTWSLASGEKAGRAAPERDAQAMSVVITADTLTFARGDHRESMKIALDATKTPKQIDLTASDGTVRLGVYELDGDTLKLCLSGSSERPKGFGTTEGTRTALMILRRK